MSGLLQNRSHIRQFARLLFIDNFYEHPISLNSLPQVTFFQRKPRAFGNYSVEILFDQLRESLADRIDASICISRYPSSGLFRRLFNCVEAWWRQGRVNHVTGDVNYLGLLMRKQSCIQTVLDCVHLENATGVKYRLLKLLWLELPEKHCRYITAISESTKQQILKHLACDPDKIKVIHVALPGGFERHDKSFNTILPRVLQIGTAPNKNVPRLIEALTGLPIHLDLVGGFNATYDQQLKQAGLSFTYRCNLNAGEMLEAYKSADIVSLVSTYEGFGMPIIEGQAIGRAVIAGNVASMPEVAGNGAGLVDPYDVQAIRQGILRIINDSAYRETLIVNGFENVKRFTPEIIANQYLQLYMDVAGTRN